MIKCLHYEGDGYTYNLGEETIDLCEDCHDILFSQMKEQKLLENQLTPDEEHNNLKKNIDKIR